MMTVRYAPWCLALCACLRTQPAPPAEKAPTPTIVADALPPVGVGPRRAAAPGARLTVAMDAEPPSLNPQQDPLDGWTQRIAALVYGRLAAPKPDATGHEGELATSWTRSEDGRTLTFFLARDVLWHDGQPFDADDVVFTFAALRDPKNKTQSVRANLDVVESIESVDAHTVRFTLKTPYWYAFDAIAETFIYPEHVYAGVPFDSAQDRPFDIHPANRAPIGTGPYRFGQWQSGVHIILKRASGEAAFDELMFRHVPQPHVRLELVRRGELDVIEHMAADQWPEMMRDAELAGRFYRLRHTPNGLQWIGWNQERSWFQDVRVRRALAMLIDRDDIIANLRHGLAQPMASWFTPGTPGHNAELKPLPHDRAAAQALLAEAGWRDSDDDGTRDHDGVPFRFTFLLPSGRPFYEQLGSLVRQSLLAAGIAVDLQPIEWGAYLARLRAHDFDACSLLWQLSPRDDPFQIWHSSQSNGGLNFISFRDATVDALLEQARVTQDPSARRALYERFAAVLHEQQPYVFLFLRDNLSLVSRRLSGIVPTAFGTLAYERLFVRQ